MPVQAAALLPAALCTLSHKSQMNQPQAIIQLCSNTPAPLLCLSCRVQARFFAWLSIQRRTPQSSLQTVFLVQRLVVPATVRQCTDHDPMLPCQVQGELDEVQVRIEPNEGSPESIQAIAPVLRALAGSLGLPANAFNGMLESIASQAQGPTRGPDQQQGSPSQPAGASPAGAAPQANRNPSQAAGASASQSQTTPPPPSSSSTAPAAADQTATQDSAAPTGSAATAPPRPNPPAPPSPLGATWQALLQALGSQPQSTAAPADSSATNRAPTHAHEPAAQPAASSPMPADHPQPSSQPREQTTLSHAPDNASPSVQLQSGASEGSPSGGPSQAPTLASVKTEEIPTPEEGSGTGSPASSATGFVEGGHKRPWPAGSSDCRGAGVCGGAAGCRSSCVPGHAPCYDCARH